ncbi:MAG: Gfo/Idh/MocA family protein [Armatimonadota bacterium]
MPKVRVAVVGTGGIARHRHIPELLGCPEAEVVALCDTDPARVREVAAKFNIGKTYTDHLDLFATEQLDAVSICTPNNSHRPISLAAIERGIHVCCEKPLAMNYAEAMEMYQAARDRDVITMVAFSYRFVPSARLLKELMDEDALGELYNVEAVYGQSHLINKNAPLAWRLQRDVAGSGVLGDLGSHLIDLCRWWVGDVAAVCARMKTFVTKRPLLGGGEMGEVDVDDTVSCVAEFVSGPVGTLTASRYFTGRGNYQRVEITGSKGSVVFRNEVARELQVCIGRHFVEPRTHVMMHTSPRHEVGQMAHFVRAVAEGRKVKPDFEDGMKAQEVMEAIEMSDANGRRVELPLNADRGPA